MWCEYVNMLTNVLPNDSVFFFFIKRHLSWPICVACQWTRRRYLTTNVATSLSPSTRKSTRHKMAPSICGKCHGGRGRGKGRYIYPLCVVGKLRAPCVKMWKCGWFTRCANEGCSLERSGVEWAGLRRLSRARVVSALLIEWQQREPHTSIHPAQPGPAAGSGSFPVWSTSM